MSYDFTLSFFFFTNYLIGLQKVKISLHKISLKMHLKNIFLSW